MVASGEKSSDWSGPTGRGKTTLFTDWWSARKNFPDEWRGTSPGTLLIGYFRPGRRGKCGPFGPGWEGESPREGTASRSATQEARSLAAGKMSDPDKRLNYMDSYSLIASVHGSGRDTTTFGRLRARNRKAREKVLHGWDSKTTDLDGGRGPLSRADGKMARGTGQGPASDCRMYCDGGTDGTTSTIEFPSFWLETVLKSFLGRVLMNLATDREFMKSSGLQ